VVGAKGFEPAVTRPRIVVPAHIAHALAT